MTHSEDEVRGNILGIFFTILSGVMIALIVLAYGTNDKDLIVGINAYDAKDGDITDRIVVEKVVLNKDAETAVVYYAVADHSGNVTKQSRVFPANIADIEFNGDSSEKIEDGMHPNISFENGESVAAASSADSEEETNGN